MTGPGVYALLLTLPHTTHLTAGRLGSFDFPAGWYVYVGSAQGPGGIAARVACHRRVHKPLRWHVDYLRACADFVEVWTAAGTERRECAWARAIGALPGATVVVPRFGSSGCRCPAHLFHFDTCPPFKAFARAVGGHVQRGMLDG